METVSHALLTFLLNALWQIPVITAVAMLACRAMRNGPASHRHAVWVTALVAAVVLPAASIRTERRSQPQQIRLSYPTQSLATAPSAAAGAKSLASAQPSHRSRSVPLARTTAAAALAGYAFFLLFCMARLTWSWVRTVQIRRGANARTLPAPVREAHEYCAAAFGLAGVELLVSSQIDSPVTVGARRKAIILPAVLFTSESKELLTAAIGHEMAHVARGDFAVKLFSELLYLPLSFHPAAWLIRRGIERNREMACDELVSRKLLDPVVYARSIVRIAAWATGLRRPGYTLGVFDCDILEERIRRLLHRPAHSVRRARLLLAGGLSALVVCAIAVSGLALSARAQNGVSAELRLAGAAYNSGDFNTAVEHFENAAKLDPTNVSAKLFLANALMRKSFVANAPPGNDIMKAARSQYLDILSHDSQNRLALEGMLAVEMHSRQFDEARQWAFKLINLDPGSVNAYYTLGVMDWAGAYPVFLRAKNAVGVKKEVYFVPDAGVRVQLRGQLMPRIDEGVRALQKALELDPEYADAMAYLNLLDRLKAGIANSAEDSAALIAEADRWVGKALAAKRAQRSPASPAPTTLDVEGPPPGPASPQSVLAAPPPPPPPALSNTQPPSPEPPPVPRNPAERPGAFWQVIGADGEPAAAVVKRLHDQGFRASFFTNEHANNVWVIAGPYAGAKAMDEAKIGLEDGGFRPVRQW